MQYIVEFKTDRYQWRMDRIMRKKKWVVPAIFAEKEDALLHIKAREAIQDIRIARNKIIPNKATWRIREDPTDAIKGFDPYKLY